MTASQRRLADVAVQLAEHLDEGYPDAVARWLYGELPDALDRLALLFMLARLAIQPGESPTDVLRRPLGVLDHVAAPGNVATSTKEAPCG